MYLGGFQDPSPIIPNEVLHLSKVIWVIIMESERAALIQVLRNQGIENLDVLECINMGMLEAIRGAPGAIRRTQGARGLLGSGAGSE